MNPTPFKKILIANRGEIALRIIRACRELGIKSVLVHSTADKDSLPARLADETVCIGSHLPKDSYLNQRAIVSAAELMEVDAIHPGYGFLSENADFAEFVSEQGFVFIGPTAQNIRMMGDKVAAKNTMIASGVPCVPGSDGALPDDNKQIIKIAQDVGLPVIIKATGGGGGRGMRVVESMDELLSAVAMTKKEAMSAFGNPVVYMERYLKNPRHIEIQVISDTHGNAIHLGERDCSMQRRHQKVIEEAPAPFISDDKRAKIGQACVKACLDMGYRGVGTFEFLYENGEFFFIEMNTRIQVEHPVTELVTGVNLIAEQIRVAEGYPLQFTQDDMQLTGHAFECRINAEHPFTLMPSAGTVSYCHLPAGYGTRVDSHLYTGYKIPAYYDSLIGKLCIHAPTRELAIAKMKSALTELDIQGVQTNKALHQAMFDDDSFIKGGVSIHYLTHWLDNYQNNQPNHKN
ncbi:acetyl-CoA carboxylase biotin carboxylase subunit [Moraxella bovis]|uniref:Biotin carboxylase n=1 Tax=Moraxella bovis TaxID=476 RepID=A0AAQ2Q679_MORBO|nr:acetyl-CoA carboxylase biotin carboxylase subunit [Moraxella bovis]UYZ76926.1 acetyl-CoA carboxylase biotin carboxylase subunit [Moraxella bovis]UYZ77124.1 acetyl-CoA carboxylase biotin carboxylase subunit [Moraxella bovis]UYZ85604.1 acetyl-CoA carboxylase biotin carboxylase subunit [Moraxella bovis]UYZ93511.1 acetyl-CoA carboxylase biotin carboxylase subunit [Moraxella bovis]UYZ99048.1 acetyl-CoA carboxylase biotin carboxylase subunit [Moraxella bovis]